MFLFRLSFCLGQFEICAEFRGQTNRQFAFATNRRTPHLARHCQTEVCRDLSKTELQPIRLTQGQCTLNSIPSYQWLFDHRQHRSDSREVSDLCHQLREWATSSCQAYYFVQRYGPQSPIRGPEPLLHLLLCIYTIAWFSFLYDLWIKNLVCFVGKRMGQPFIYMSFPTDTVMQSEVSRKKWDAYDGFGVAKDDC